MLNGHVPRFPEKHKGTPKFDALEFMKKHMDRLEKLPEKAIVVFSSTLYSQLHESLATKGTDYPYGGLFETSVDESSGLMLIKLYPGAPLIANTVEEISALGVKKILSLGTAGSINKMAKFDDLVLCTKALKDEGVSQHYTDSDAYSYPSPEMNSDISEFLESRSIEYLSGPTWTTDAPYMETLEEIKHYSGIGILTVEMEASAMFTVASRRNVQAASVFSISDELNDAEWNGIRTPEKGFRNLQFIAKNFADSR